MADLFVFNPENDIALACASTNFTAPKNALLMRRCCDSVMVWLTMNEDDYVLVSRDPSDNWKNQIRAVRGHLPQFVKDAHGLKINRVVPWGWSRVLKNRLLELGVDESVLPSDDRLIRIRHLSHRRTSLHINQYLQDMGVDIPPLAIEANDISAIMDYLARHDRVVIKAPWSSSGRGVVDSALLNRQMFTDRCEGVIRHQGSIMVEKFLDRVLDFAMLFELNGGRCRYIGLSRFVNSRTGSYDGNIVCSQAIHHNAICRHIDADQLTQVRHRLMSALEKIIGAAYEGYCGVDMMIYNDENFTPRLAPCIEINLRTTMGIMAESVGKYFITDENQSYLLRTDYAHGKIKQKQLLPVLDLTPPADFTTRLYQL